MNTLSIFQNELGEFEIDNMYFEFDTEKEIEAAYNEWTIGNQELVDLTSPHDCPVDTWDAKQAYIKAWKLWKKGEDTKNAAQDAVAKIVTELETEKNVAFKSNRNGNSYYAAINGVNVRISTHDNGDKGGFNQATGESYDAADITASHDLANFSTQIDKIKAL